MATSKTNKWLLGTISRCTSYSPRARHYLPRKRYELRIYRKMQSVIAELTADKNISMSIIGGKPLDRRKICGQSCVTESALIRSRLHIVCVMHVAKSRCR